MVSLLVCWHILNCLDSYNISPFFDILYFCLYNGLYMLTTVQWEWDFSSLPTTFINTSLFTCFFVFSCSFSASHLQRRELFKKKKEKKKAQYDRKLSFWWPHSPIDQGGGGARRGTSSSRWAFRGSWAKGRSQLKICGTEALFVEPCSWRVTFRPISSQNIPRGSAAQRTQRTQRAH